MKQILVLFTTCSILFSCIKDTNTPAQPQQNISGSISYKVNGAAITMDNANVANGEGVVFAKQLKGIVPETRYLLNGEKGSNNIIGLTIITDSLDEIGYHYDSTIMSSSAGAFAFTIAFNGQLASTFYNSDVVDINITSYKNSTISGTFRATLTPVSAGGNGEYNNRGSILITDGVFDKIPVTY